MKEYEFTGKAMGTDYAISVVCNSEKDAADIARKTIDEIQAYEKRFSRFLPDSELTKLNETKNMAVSAEFMTVTKKAHELFKLTDGFFNPLVQIGRMGYDKDFSKIDGSTALDAADIYDIDFNTTELDEKNNCIILQAGQKLDFGGFLKGYLAELLCKKIMKYSAAITGAIVNIGGDIHTQGLDETGELFTFDIYNPITEKEIPVTLHNQSLATSGTYKRTWMKSNAPMHHILDASGLHNPDSDIVSASVIGTDDGATEAYTKVFLSLGEKAAAKFSKENILFVTIKKDGTVTKNFS